MPSNVDTSNAHMSYITNYVAYLQLNKDCIEVAYRNSDRP